MKDILLRTSFFLCLLFVLYSCDDDCNGVDGPSLFTIHAGEINGSGDQYIMATSPLTGELLFWDKMTRFEDNISFDAGGHETVDLTYASEINSSFKIITYRDIETEFKLSTFLFPCYIDQFTSDSFSFKFGDIILNGTKEIVEIVNPAYDHSDINITGNIKVDARNKIVYDYDNNITIVNVGLGYGNLDHQFVFRFLDEQEYKSIIVKSEDWIEVDNDNYKLELEYQDLSLCEKHSIEVGNDGSWIVESEIVTAIGDRMVISKWSTYTQNQTGETINLFLQSGLEVEQLLLKVRKSNNREGFQFQRSYDHIPSSISLKEYSHEISYLTHNAFNYSTTENIDLVKTSFKYINNNWISSWDIFHPSASSSNYELPEIESEYLDETILMKSSLKNPVRFKVQFYSIDNDISHIYHKTGINRQLPCLDFDSSYESYEF